MADIRVCPCCSAENGIDRYFCTSCGTFLQKKELSENAGNAESFMFLLTLKENRITTKTISMNNIKRSTENHILKILKI